MVLIYFHEYVTFVLQPDNISSLPRRNIREKIHARLINED